MYPKQWPELKAIPNETVYQVRRSPDNVLLENITFIFQTEIKVGEKKSQKTHPKRSAL